MMLCKTATLQVDGLTTGPRAQARSIQTRLSSAQLFLCAPDSVPPARALGPRLLSPCSSTNQTQDPTEIPFRPMMTGGLAFFLLPLPRGRKKKGSDCTSSAGTWAREEELPLLIALGWRVPSWPSVSRSTAPDLAAGALEDRRGSPIHWMGTGAVLLLGYSRQNKAFFFSRFFPFAFSHARSLGR